MDMLEKLGKVQEMSRETGSEIQEVSQDTGHHNTQGVGGVSR